METHETLLDSSTLIKIHKRKIQKLRNSSSATTNTPSFQHFLTTTKTEENKFAKKI
jgi:hypothetical protein